MNSFPRHLLKHSANVTRETQKIVNGMPTYVAEVVATGEPVLLDTGPESGQPMPSYAQDVVEERDKTAKLFCLVPSRANWISTVPEANRKIQPTDTLTVTAFGRTTKWKVRNFPTEQATPTGVSHRELRLHPLP